MNTTSPKIWQGDRTASGMQPKPRGQDKIIASESLQIERKKFTITLRENDRGRILKITEEAGGRRDSIIVPANGRDAFLDALNKVWLSEI